MLKLSAISYARVLQWVHLFSVILCLSASPLLAQGLTETVSGASMPESQTATVNNMWGIGANPAGMAYIDSFELVGGYHGMYNDPLNPLHRFQLAMGNALADGVVLGSGLTHFYYHDDQRDSITRVTQSMAFHVGRSLSFGGQAHVFIPAVKNPQLSLRGDFGMQFRFSEWFATGLMMEGLGVLEPTDRTTLRLGIALRPLWDFLTFGADLRAIPGSHELASDAFYQDADVETAFTTKVSIGGLGVTGGVTLSNFSNSNLNDIAYRGGVSVEVNTAFLGAMLLGEATQDMAFGGGVYGRLSGDEYPSVIPERGQWARFTLSGNGEIEYSADNIIEELLLERAHPIAVLAGLNRIASDPSIDGVSIRLRNLSIGWGQAAELRDAIFRIKENGKKVVVHLNGGDDTDMYLASAADRIYLTPGGSLSVDGLQIVLTYVAETLRRVGLNATAVTAGEYKSAPRTFVADEPNEAELEVQNVLLNELFKAYIDAVSSGRNIKKEDVLNMIDKGGLNSDEALAARFVDALVYSEDLGEQIKKDFELSRVPRAVKASSYLDDNERNMAWQEKDRIAIIPIVGGIQMSNTGGFNPLGGDGAAADEIRSAIRAASKDNKVKAVVIRIDSPGGDALASDLIWKAVMDLREKKPVVVSMGDTAASGGYYIASAGQEIFAEANTITGSIGVFTLMFDGEEMLDELGISSYELNRGQKPGPSFMRKPTEGEREAIQTQVDWVYEKFLQAIATGRNVEKADILPHAGGRVWTGSQAYERKLVDNIGGIHEATARARELASIPPEQEVDVAILSGRDEIIPRVTSVVSVLSGKNALEDDLRQLVRLWIGPQTDTAMIGLSRKPMAASPVQIQVE